MRSEWLPAVSSDDRGQSAGVAIFVRKWMGLMWPGETRDSCEVAKHRAIVVRVNAPAVRPMMMYSAYFFTGQGLSKFENAMMVATNSMNFVPMLAILFTISRM